MKDGDRVKCDATSHIKEDCQSNGKMFTIRFSTSLFQTIVPTLSPHYSRRVSLLHTICTTLQSRRHHSRLTNLSIHP
ncbi:hypothetical protein B9Z55_024658 [Caenorhabditis nigoni]|uniref:Uncharacterized protein n=1 Tax=Caenorhabditis nigoni TaxID=1611254 RepID=A0A2G5SVH8_9PELO|nr:hypothetical protein B9Z55_024658 [Caenorhabditis nigoni]